MPATNPSTAPSGDITMNNTAAIRLDHQFDQVLADAQDLLSRNIEMTGRDSDLGQSLVALADALEVMNYRYWGSNPAGLSTRAHELTTAGFRHLTQFIDFANKNQLNVNDVQAIVSELDTLMPDGRPHLPPPPPPAVPTTANAVGGTAQGASATGTVGDLAPVTASLVDARAADTVDGKASALGQAIDSLIAALTTPPAPPAPPAATVPAALTNAMDAISGLLTAPLPPPAPMADVSLSGQDLADALRAGNRELTVRDGHVGVAGGTLNNEIDHSERVVYRPEGGLVGNGATIEISRLFSGSRGADDIQERGFITVFRPDGSRDHVRLNGTHDGNQTVTIEGAFTHLAFRAAKNEGETHDTRSEFSLRSISHGQLAADSVSTTPSETQFLRPGHVPSSASNHTHLTVPTYEGTGETDRIAGHELEAHVSAGGRALNMTREGILGVKGGGQNDEIDSSERLVFTPPQGVSNGATVEIAKLFGEGSSRDNITEQGWVRIYRPDGTVDSQRFEGTRDGAQTIEIEGPFTKLVFGTPANEGRGSSNQSDYGIRAITVEGARQTNAEPTPPVASGGSGGDTAPIAFDPTSMIGLISALDGMLDSLQGANVPDAQKEEGLDAIMRVMEEVTSAMGNASDGGQMITGRELTEALADLSGVIDAAGILGEGAGPHLDAIAGGLEAIVSSLPA